MRELNGFELYREIKRLDKKVKVCFLTAGEMFYGPYSDIFSSLNNACNCGKCIGDCPCFLYFVTLKSNEGC
jgi:hypothetical protein